VWPSSINRLSPSHRVAEIVEAWTGPPVFEDETRDGCVALRDSSIPFSGRRAKQEMASKVIRAELRRKFGDYAGGLPLPSVIASVP
jgi:hypothetical protein